MVHRLLSCTGLAVGGRGMEILMRTDAFETLMRVKVTGEARAIGISAKTPDVRAPFNQRERYLEHALTKAHDQKLGIIAIKRLSSGHLEASAAIQFALRQPLVDSLVIGTTDKKHLREAAAKTVTEPGRRMP